MLLGKAGGISFNGGFRLRGSVGFRSRNTRIIVRIRGRFNDVSHAHVCFLLDATLGIIEDLSLVIRRNGVPNLLGVAIKASPGLVVTYLR